MADEYGSVSSTIDADKRALLAAAATGGSAGVAAYKEGQAALAASRQASVARAAQLAGLIGGPEAQGFDAISNRQYDQGTANLGTAQATFGADMARRSGAFHDYLSKAQASIPAYRAQTDRQVALKRASADATASKSSAKGAADISIQGLLGLATQAQSAARPTGPVDFGAPQQPNESIEQYLARLNTSAQGRRDTDAVVAAPLNDLAAQIGRTIGVPDTKLAELYGPTVTKSLPKPADATDTVAKALATKYDTKGVTYDTAKSALGGEDFKTFVTWLQSGADGMSQEEAADRIRRFFLNGEGRQGGNAGPWVAEYEILMGEYVPRLAE